MSRAIFFDRDGTLVGPAPSGLAAPVAHRPEHVVLLDGVLDALAEARRAGFLLVVVTNQPGPAKGQYTAEAVQATNARLLELCRAGGSAIDALYACLHHPVGGPGGDPALIRPCECRKPNPGMLLRAAADLGVDLGASALIGDEARDMDAGKAAGVRTFRVGPGALTIREAVRLAIREAADPASHPEDECRSS